MRVQTNFAKGKPRFANVDAGGFRFYTAIIDPDWPYTVAPGKEKLKDVDGLSWKGRLSGFTRNRDISKNIYTRTTALSIDELKELPIREIVGGYVFLWTVGPFLINGSALEVIKAWGLEPCSIITWAKYDLKNNHGYGGVGYWFLGNAEFCIVCKQQGWPSIRTGKSSLLIAPKMEHSRKPDNIHDLCETRFPGPYLEIFARKRDLMRPGWTMLGDEIDGVDIRKSLEALHDSSAIAATR